MYQPPLRSLAEELEQARKLLRDRNAELLAELGPSTVDRGPAPTLKRSGPMLGHADNSGSPQRHGQVESKREKLHDQLTNELANLDELTRTGKLEGHTGAQMAREAMALRIKDASRDQAFRQPNREFNAQAKEPAHFDKPRLKIEEWAEMNDPPARKLRQELHEQQQRTREQEASRAVPFGRQLSEEQQRAVDAEKAELWRRELEEAVLRELVKNKGIDKTDDFNKR